MKTRNMFAYKNLALPCLSALFLFLASLLVNAGNLMEKMANDEAADFTLMSATGADISLTDYRGKFVLINFWATWCRPCVKEMPALNRLHNKLKAGSNFHIVGVHVGPGLATVKQFLKDRPVDFDIVIDKNMALAGWPVAGLPTTFLISPTGKLIYKAVGEREWDSAAMIEFLTSVIKEYERLASAQKQSSKG